LFLGENYKTNYINIRDDMIFKKVTTCLSLMSRLKNGAQHGVTNYYVCSDMNIFYPISDIEISIFPFFSSFFSSI